MGHERLGALPRTKRWHNVVQGIGAHPSGEVRIAEIARATIDNVQGRIDWIRNDDGVRSVVLFLVGLSIASRQPNPRGFSPWEITLPENPTPLALGLSLRLWVHQRRGGGEYTELATQAATDALAQWKKRYQYAQGSLFDAGPDPYATWKKAGRGDGFSELSHLFFTNFTRRYLNYFLEREASSELQTIKDREQFDAEVMSHAAETAKITQSFAAGWFNKHASEGLPSEKEVEGFIAFALGKIKEELLREREAT